MPPLSYEAVEAAAVPGERPRSSTAARVASACASMLAVAAVVALAGRGSEHLGGVGLEGQAAPMSSALSTQELAVERVNAKQLAARVEAISAALSTHAQPAKTQRLVVQDIPGSDNSSVVPDPWPPNLCTIKGKVVGLSPVKWFCAQPAHCVDSCATCTAECLSPGSQNVVSTCFGVQGFGVH